MLRKKWKAIVLSLIVVSVSTAALWEYRRIYILNDRLGCVTTQLEKAKTLHQIQMEEPSNFTGDTMQKLMDSVEWAYGCATKEPSHSRIAPGGGFFWAAWCPTAQVTKVKEDTQDGHKRWNRNNSSFQFGTS
jgi:hypothetical protein